MTFTSDDRNMLLALPQNQYLLKCAEDKYADFGKKDPFPQITASLLNSKDIIQYILTTGMVDPFIPENLKGATYACEFSGKYVYWDNDKVQNKASLNDSDYLYLLPNSIAFLEINPVFRVPEYMVLRFNLQVRNVYKGLLLGTGPIVDPGFRGRLFIPLHNLTSNEYMIKKGAHLISVEFTKLSKNKKWDLSKTEPLKSIAATLNFNNVSYVPTAIQPNREIDAYIIRALQDEKNFLKKDPNLVFVNSSMQGLDKKLTDKLSEQEKKISSEIESIEKTGKDVQEHLDRSVSHEGIVKWFSIVAVGGLMLTAIGLFITARTYFSNSSQLSNATKQFENQKKEFAKSKSDMEKLIDELKRRVEDLENQSNFGKTPCNTLQ